LPPAFHFILFLFTAGFPVFDILHSFSFTGLFPGGGNSLNKSISTLPAIMELRLPVIYDIMQSSKKNTAGKQENSSCISEKRKQHGTANRKTKKH